MEGKYLLEYKYLKLLPVLKPKENLPNLQFPSRGVLLLKYPLPQPEIPSKAKFKSSCRNESSIFISEKLVGI